MKHLLVGNNISDEVFDFFANVPTEDYALLVQRADESFVRQLERLAPRAPHKALLINGPPGCGKTSAAALVVTMQWRAKRRSICCAPSNRAATTLAHKIGAAATGADPA